MIVAQGKTLSTISRAGQAAGDGKKAANWMQQTVLAHLNESGGSIDEYSFSPEGIAEFIRVHREEKVDLSRLKEISVEFVMNIEFLQSVSATLVRDGKIVGPQVIDKEAVAKGIAAKGVGKVDASELESLCREIVAANAKIVADVKGGKLQAVGALVGQAKKKNPNANPNDVRRICLEIIAKM